MEYSPPPLFKQGPSALARLIFFVLVALALLISDARFRTLEIVRGVLGAGLYPLQRAALVPRWSRSSRPREPGLWASTGNLSRQPSTEC